MEMKMNSCIIKEAAGLLEYKAPELREFGLSLALGIDEYKGTSDEDWVFGAAADDGEENGTFSLDD